MEQASNFVRNKTGTWVPIVLGIVLLWVVYTVYTYLYPSSDSNYVKFLSGEVDARKPITLEHWQTPDIFTGGDFTFSMWIYIDDWNYKASSNKFLFAISPLIAGSQSPLVGLLTSLTNGLVVRAATSQSTPPIQTQGSNGSGLGSGGSSMPDITQETILQNVLNQKMSVSSGSAYGSGSSDNECDVKDVNIQRWTNITIVNSGRVLDIYMDGRLTRSCMLDNVLFVPRGQLKLRLGESGGFGGRYSCIQMWNQQLTPDLIYGIYQQGPVQKSHGILSDIAQFFNLNVTFTGGGPMNNPTAPGSTCTGNNLGSQFPSLSQLETQGVGMMNRFGL